MTSMPAITWQRSGERRAGVAEAPGGETLTVSQQAHRNWVPAVLGTDGQTRWRGGPHSTRPAAQQAAEAEAHPDSTPLILDLFGSLMLEAAEQFCWPPRPARRTWPTPGAFAAGTGGT